MGIVALDSNIFIRALDDPGTLGKKSRKLLEDFRQNLQKVSISVLVLEEFFVRVYKEKREKDVGYILDFIALDGLIQLVDVNREIALLAAKIRARHTIKAPDAIHLASAINCSTDIFITTDKKLPRKVGKLKIQVLA